MKPKYIIEYYLKNSFSDFFSRNITRFLLVNSDQQLEKQIWLIVNWVFTNGLKKITSAVKLSLNYVYWLYITYNASK